MSFRIRHSILTRATHRDPARRFPPASPRVSLLLLPLLLLLRPAGVASAATNVSGNQSGTWSSAGSPYIMVGAVTVPTGQTLTIQAGVEVRAAASQHMNVQGSLVTQGTLAQPVVFTSNAALPAPGDWYGIATNPGCTLDLAYTELHYGGQGGFPEIYVSGRAALVNWVGGGAFQSASAGASIQSTTTTLSNLTFGANATAGLLVDSTHPPTLATITCTGNGQYGIKVNTNPGSLPNTLSGSGNGYNGIYVTGTLGGAEAGATWTWGANPGFPYLLANTTIPAAQTLQLGAGAIVKALNSTVLTVNGTLRTLGTSPAPVLFTSLADDSQGGNSNAADGAVSPAPGLWYGIATGTNCVLDLAQTNLCYGGLGGYSNIYVGGRAASITWNGGGTCYSAGYGANLQAVNMTLSNLVVNNNGHDGLHYDSTHPATLSWISASHNARYALSTSVNPGNFPNTLSGSGNGYNAVYISGTLGGADAPATWSWGANPTLPYACGAPVVPAGTTLQVAAGAVVKFAPSGYLTLGGTLQAQGTTSAPVWFTSLADDAHGGDSNAADGAVTLGRGYWYGIATNTNCTLQLTSTWIGYGGLGGYSNIYVAGRATLIDWNGGGAVGSASVGASLQGVTMNLANLAVDGNAQHGLVIDSTHPATMSRIACHNNGQYALVVNTNPGNYPSTLSGSGNGLNGLYVSGTLGGTEPAATWTWGANPLFPYVIASPVIPAGVTLNIAAGAVVKAQPSGQLAVNGTLNCQGTAAAPGTVGTREATLAVDAMAGAARTAAPDPLAPAAIAADAPVWFTSLKDDVHGGDTNADGATSAPAPGDWYGILPNSGSTLTFNQTWLAYAGLGGYAPVYGTTTALTWTGGGTINNAGYGIYASAPAISISGVRARGNTWGMVFNATGTAVLTNCDISNNSVGGLTNNNVGHTIDARNCWWGDASGPLDPTNGNPDYNPTGLGNKVSDYVQYRPFLAAPAHDTPPGNFALLNPLQDVTIPNTPVQFHWSPAVDPDGDTVTYDLQVDDDPLFGSPAITANGLSVLTYTSSGFLGAGVTYYWCVVARDGHGGECLATPGTGVFNTVPAVSGVGDGLPTVCAVGLPLPNPTRVGSSVHFNLPAAGHVAVALFDVRGRLVRRVLDGPLSAGAHDVAWDGRDADGTPVPPGVYFYRFVTAAGDEVRRVVLAR